jgi:hypothetical protein
LLRSQGGYLYLGCVSLVLGVAGLCFGRPRRELVFWSALFVFGVLCARGDQTPVFRWVFQFIPGAPLFRGVYRYLYLCNFALAVLVAHGFDALRAARVRERWFWAPFVGLALTLLGGALALMQSSLWARAIVKQELTYAAVMLVLVWGALRLVRAQAPRLQQLGALLVGLALCGDHGYHAHDHAVSRSKYDEKIAVSAQALARLQRASADYRMFNETGLGPRGGTRFAVRDFRGYMDPLNLERYHQLVYGPLSKAPSALLSLFNVRYVVKSKTSRRHFVRKPRTHGWAELEHDLFELPDPAPRAYWVGAAQLLPDDDAVRKALARLDWHRSVLLAKADLSAEQARGLRTLTEARAPARAARVVDSSLNGVSFQVDAPAPGLLVINESWFPGFAVAVDGVRTELLRANSLMQAVRIGAGKHRVQLQFRPWYFLGPSVLAALVLSTFLLSWAWQRWGAASKLAGLTREERVTGTPAP